MNTHRHPRRHPRHNLLSFLAALLLCASVWTTPAPAAAGAPAAASSSGYTQVSAGYGHTCALKSDGSLACWGSNNRGQATPPNPNSGFTQVSAGWDHTCAVKSDTSVVCWGYNYYGSATPPAANSGFTQVSARGDHTCAVKSSGALACWGNNYYGQATPPNPNSGFTQVSVGSIHTCALKSDGAIACWGDSDYGTLTPPAPNSGFTQVSTGSSHACALRVDGTLTEGGAIACWGYDDYGMLTPPTPNSGFSQVSAGDAHTCARKNDGSLACWGWNSSGQVSPLPSFNSGFSQVSAGAGHTCALKEDGALICWGNNEAGQAPVISLSPDLPASIVYGDSYTQALTASGGPGGAPYTFDVFAGVLPPGLALTATGLSGAPTQAGSYTFTLRVLDSARYMSIRAYTLEVARAQLRVRADNQTRLVGSPNPPLTYTLSGLKNGDGLSAFGGTPPVLLTTAAPTSPPGSYPIYIWGSLTSPNYDIAYVTGWLHIEGMQVFLPAALR